MTAFSYKMYRNEVLDFITNKENDIEDRYNKFAELVNL